ncbi:MAG: hypothetical protein KZQ70_06010 [gamma proteobacterium symbiont of Lucinoma myriamae]|nr:hypothetical protein [gamma proteobacterium symbiont of Lucinoma myriamae]MCU7817874.1 hypothetical protein [gamma proteobacterium symbiont of Lucinoma myriamae]MCU7832079.1 hypothetical protein [gamma proteobacterium symbiont of Lucinoma myriamae]
MTNNNEIDHLEEESEIIDFQSEDRSDTQSNIKPVPTGIKWMLAGIVAVFIVGIGGLYLSKSDKSLLSTNNDETVELSDNDDLFDGVNETISLEAPEENTQVVKNIVNKPGLTLSPVSEEELLNERVTSMEAQLQKMTQQMMSFSKQGEVVNQLTTQVTQLSEVMKDVVTQDDLSKARQSFRERMQQFRSEIEATVAKSYKKKTYVRRKKSTPAKNMPFKLLSIDQWDGVHYAAIQSKNVGAIENLRVGDRRSGWKVEKIDVTESQVMFKNIKTGQSVKQTVI